MPQPFDELPAQGKGGPFWFQIMDRFGFPTLIALIVIGMLIVYARWAREDMATERAAFLGAIKQNTAAVDSMADTMKLIERGMEQTRKETETQSYEMRLLRQTLTDRKPR